MRRRIEERREGRGRGVAGEGRSRGRCRRGCPALHQFPGSFVLEAAVCSLLATAGSRLGPAPDPTPGRRPRTWLLAPRPARRLPVSRPASPSQAGPCDLHAPCDFRPRAPPPRGGAGGRVLLVGVSAGLAVCPHLQDNRQETRGGRRCGVGAGEPSAYRTWAPARPPSFLAAHHLLLTGS